jgi:glycosyltransferase involved in cell wall biosynthesis
LPLNKMKPLPRWVDTEQFTPAKKVAGFWQQHGIETGATLIYVGRVSREKSLELLIGAFRTLVDDGMMVSLAIVGDGPYRQEMEETLTGYPVTFTGFLQGEQLQQAYASADLFVFPSATDTFGNVVLEAQASGIPVIVSDSGGPRELMIDGETGLVFHAGDCGHLIAAIRRLVAEPALLADMGANARAFTIAKAPDTTDTYSTILQPSAKAA